MQEKEKAKVYEEEKAICRKLVCIIQSTDISLCQGVTFASLMENVYLVLRRQSRVDLISKLLKYP